VAPFERRHLQLFSDSTLSSLGVEYKAGHLAHFVLGMSEKNKFYSVVKYAFLMWIRVNLSCDARTTRMSEL